MIVILNFDNQFAQLIAWCVRDLGVKAEIFLFDAYAETIKVLRALSLIFSGGHESFLRKRSPVISFRDLWCF